MGIKLGKIVNREEYVFYCPGCKICHQFELPKWKFNKDLENPTVSPSLLMRGGQKRNLTSEEVLPRCHLYIRNGNIQFLKDCTHPLKNQTIPMVDWEGNWYDEWWRPKDEKGLRDEIEPIKKPKT